MAPDARADDEAALTDTIFALSSGAPPAAIAVVRVSGPAANNALSALGAAAPKPRVARLATLRVGGEILDRALVIRFPGPHSATGEDLVELHLHGGRAVVAAVLAALGSIARLRPALPGEFTRRAFENGRLDLAEAEGLADLLAAETQSQRRAAQALAGGALSRQVEAWQQQLLGLAAQVEALLDFSDEGEVGDALPETWRADLARLTSEVAAFLAKPGAERLRDGLRVVIAGPPNAGKSTLLNRLAGRDAAITSDIPGTTRDLVEAPIALAGTPLLVIDTAGLRDSEDRIERIGVDRARASLDAADLILWLGAPGECPDRSKAIVIAAKSDLHGEARDPGAEVSVSAETGEGMDALTALLTARARALLPHEGEVALNARHRAALGQLWSQLDEAALAHDPLLAAEALRQGRLALDAVTGRAGVEDMLDALFGRFCIGK